ncbi:hypothetical protein CLV31_12911 [Algoriphagus aquaeductus]|uniref:Uncharacterized protein n=1 Tax=Algoriphagus aquaeductus TaxID=475299 RepID=A0A326RUJ2_9BACT|nr:hypothetical protein [Algoriphagus aquaeductus]PZV76015.1 hypothetical protein CLV31_12911 [Algoriphagus aquaeductus]
MAKSECKRLKIKLNVELMESVDSKENEENKDSVDFMDFIDSVDLTPIAGHPKSQLYCSFDVALMQL